jgi:hypothetical protein
LQAGFTDRLLGRFLARLRKTGLWDKALIVVTVDEGDSFRGGDNRRDPTTKNIGDIAFIPLFVKLPGQNDGGIIDRHVTSIDVLPTIASVLGVKMRWKHEGRSVLSSEPGSDTVRIGKFTTSFGAAQALRQRALERKLKLFGSGTWGPELSGTGPYRRLVGRALGSVRIAGSVAASATVDRIGSRLLRALPKRSQLIPSPLAGSVAGLRPGDALAFAFNGRIAAVTQVYRGQRFSALAAESAFRAGRNSVRAFLVTGGPSAPQLRELRVKLSG